MAKRSMTICAYPGCNTLVIKGRCDKHKATSNRPNQRTSQRGYDHKWRQIRAEVLRDSTVCQYQTHCDGAKATEVDHRDGNSRNNNRTNLVATCKRCHSYKTVTFDIKRDRGRFDGKRT